MRRLTRTIPLRPTVTGSTPLFIFIFARCSCSLTPPFPHSPVISQCQPFVPSYRRTWISPPRSSETYAKQPSAIPRPLMVSGFHHRIPISRPTGLNEVRGSPRYGIPSYGRVIIFTPKSRQNRVEKIRKKKEHKINLLTDHQRPTRESLAKKR